MPDLNFVNREVPAGEVLNKLGVKTDGRYFHCWRADHGRGFKVGVHLRTNMVKCFACGGRSLSVVDVVMSIRGLKVGEAARWLASEFGPVPFVSLEISPTGRRLYSSENWPEKPSIEALVRVGAWARFSHGAHGILPVILEEASRRMESEPVFRMGQREMLKKSGLGNHRTLKAAYSELASTGLIALGKETTGKVSAHGHAVTEGIIRLQWGSPQFRYWLDGVGVMQNSKGPGAALLPNRESAALLPQNAAELPKHNQLHGLSSPVCLPENLKKPVENFAGANAAAKRMPGQPMTAEEEGARRRELAQQGEAIRRLYAQDSANRTEAKQEPVMVSAEAETPAPAPARRGRRMRGRPSSDPPRVGTV